jgi:putative ABC transport system permease protein
MNDITYALRTLRHAKWFSATALVTLALGIGANTGIFSVIEAVLLRQLPYRDPDRIVMVWVKNPQQGFDHDVTSYPRLLDWRVQSKMIGGFAAYTGTSRALTGSDHPEQLRGVAASANFFDVLGVRPAIGAVFSMGDDELGRAHKVVLSHALWVRRFGGNAAIIGQIINLDGRGYTVSGVMPTTFRYPNREIDFWEPLVVRPELRVQRGAFWLTVIARLNPGVTLAQAQQEMNAISQGLAAQYREDRGLSASLVGLKHEMTANIRPALLVVSVAVALVLLIACANVAGMLIARAADRRREIALRSALGAGRGRVIRQLLTEALVLFVLGGALGFAVAAAGVRAIMRLAPANLSQIQNVQMNWKVAFYALGVAIATGLLFGAAPAFHVARSEIADAIRSGSRGIAGQRGATWFRSILLGAEVALCLVLLTGAGLLLRSFYQLQSVDLGFDAHNVLAARLNLPHARYDNDAKVNAFFDGLLMRLRSVPGVESADAISTLLLDRLPGSAGFSIEGRPKDISTPLTYDSVTPDFFRTMRIPLLRGRFFTAADTETSKRVTIINATTARRYWPNEDAIGKRIRFGAGTNNPNPWLTIVGVVADTKRAGLDSPVFTESYQPLHQSPATGMSLVIRTKTDPQNVVSALRAALRDSDPQQPIANVASIESMLDDTLALRRFNMLLVTIFAGASLVLAAVGVYGLLAYIVAQEQHEIGIRIALGASAVRIIRAVASQVIVATAGGVISGILASLAASRAITGFLYGTGALDPATYGLAILLLAIVVATAAILPLTGALNVDPAVTLRAQ